MSAIRALALLPILLLAGCGAAPALGAAPLPERPIELQLPEPVAHPITFAVGGDSITTLEYLGAPRGELSWINSTDPTFVTYAGGYAVSGSKASDVLANFGTVDADVLVLMLGTNDVLQGVAPATSMSALDAIVAASGLTDADVVVSLIAPNDRLPDAAAAYNVVLAEHAAARGWWIVDPWTAVRSPAGTYVPGAAYDDLHPNGVTQATTGAEITAAILGRVGR